MRTTYTRDELVDFAAEENARSNDAYRSGDYEAARSLLDSCRIALIAARRRTKGPNPRGKPR